MPAGSRTTTTAWTGGLGSRATRNTALILLARVLSRLLALVTVIVVSAHLGPTRFGQFQTLITYSALVAILLDLGFNTLYVREGARHPSAISRYLDAILSAKLLAGLITLVALALVLRIPGLGRFTLPGFALLLLTGYSNSLRATFYALQRLRWEAIAIVLESCLLLGLVAVGALAHAGIGYYVWAYAASYGAACVYAVVVISRHGLARIRWQLDLPLLRRWIWMALPLASIYLLLNAYFTIDVPLLQHFRPYREVGWYSLAYKPFEALLFIPFTLRGVVFPTLAIYAERAPYRIQEATEKLYRGLLLLGWPCTVGLALLAPGVDRLLHLYPQSTPALQILALGIVFMFVDNTFVAALTALDHQALFARIPLAGLIFNVGANLLVIPHFGYIGASWTTVATEVFLAVVGWRVVARLGLRLHLRQLSWRILLAGLVMGAALWPLRHLTGAAVLLPVALGVVVYLVALVVMRALDETERGVLRRALHLPV
ncbi:MAG TPA: flippase [Candidatus Dormibacteraeota bacterium]|nr:flippase [Candidatus Dormibacteraeota bacterium]